VCLKRICNLKNVNALAQDQSLVFAPDGLTIVYGDTCSGKSGFARVIKAMVSARHAAKDRFARFSAYMTDTTQRDAIIAERMYAEALSNFRELAFAT
jgi:Tfp pilus assembly pilus retraction ATPase PilT